MLDITEDIDALTNFKRQTSKYLARLKKSGRPLVLTINGKAELVVQNAASYQKLLEAAERLEAIEGIRRGLEDVDKGRTRSLGRMKADKKKKHGA
jgi:PHD/YefM family antitoxin component YafN of YafNO toxin-antitoxin module